MNRESSGFRVIAAMAIGLGLFAILGWLVMPQVMALAPSPLGRTAPTLLGDQSQVRIEGFAFTPRNLTIRAGTTVRWENFDAVTHTVTSVTPTELFDSGSLGQGDSFQFQFTKPGIYLYRCNFHPLTMTGTVTVIVQTFLPIVMR